MKMKITEEQKQKIAIQMLKKQPVITLGQAALCKLGQTAIQTNAEKAELTTDATVDGKRYELKMVITYKLKK